jgi:hypothetical protein
MDGEFLVYNGMGHGYAEFGGTYEECQDYIGFSEKTDLMIIKNRDN